MAALKKHMMTILFGLAVAGSLGLAGWAYTAGDDVKKKVEGINNLANTVRSAGTNAANTSSIQKRKEISERRVKAIDDAVDAVLRPQKYNVFEGRVRQLLIDGILPDPKSDAAMIDFKRKFNEAFAEINDRLRARGKPTGGEVQLEIEQGGGATEDADVIDRPWGPDVVDAGGTAGPMVGQVTVAEALSSNPGSRVAERIAKSIFMYVEPGAMGPHEAGSEKTPLNAERIWHAHMTLWIAQDFAAALGDLNEKRAAELEAAGRGYDAWVGNMPVKHIRQLVIDDKLGRGGGINVAVKMNWAESFTRDKNDAQHFMVPLRLTLVIEESAVMDVMQAICSAGYYTPLRVDYRAVAPNAIQEDYIYGDDPVVELVIDLEAYFFRIVYENWIPEPLKKILATPDAYEESNRGRG